MSATVSLFNSGRGGGYSDRGPGHSHGRPVTGRGVLGAAPPCEQGAGLRFGRDDGHPVEDTLVDPGISPRSTITPGPPCSSMTPTNFRRGPLGSRVDAVSGEQGTEDIRREDEEHHRDDAQHDDLRPSQPDPNGPS